MFCIPVDSTFLNRQWLLMLAGSFISSRPLPHLYYRTYSTAQALTIMSCLTMGVRTYPSKGCPLPQRDGPTQGRGLPLKGLPHTRVYGSTGAHLPQNRPRDVPHVTEGALYVPYARCQTLAQGARGQCPVPSGWVVARCNRNLRRGRIIPSDAPTALMWVCDPGPWTRSAASLLKRTWDPGWPRRIFPWSHLWSAWPEPLQRDLPVPFIVRSVLHTCADE